MKKLLILLFSILISFNSYGEWSDIAENTLGDIYNIDLDNVKEYGGYIYYWEWVDYLEPTSSGKMGAISYNQGDCGVNRIKMLSVSFYDNPMFKGQGDAFTPPEEWRYPKPNSVGKIVLDYVCEYVK